MARAPADEPEPDRREGAPHPRDAPALFGQEAAEAEFLAAWEADRLHSGWLLAGPEGVGKATFAYRAAIALVSHARPPASLEADGAAPDARQVRAGAHPRVFVLKRGLDDRGKLRSVITVDEARGLRGFFALSATDGGRRVVIVDAADELNANAANAILKLLEEPPAGAVLLLVAHQPARLLPTVRSRCRVLRFAALGPADMGRALGSVGLEAPDPAALGALAEGSVGEAARLAGLGGLEAYAEMVALLGTLPRLDRARAVALAEGGRGLLIDLLGLLLARLARAGLGAIPEAAPGEGALHARLSPDARAARVWAGLHAEALGRARAGLAVNLDPAALILDMLLAIEEAARAAVPA